MSDLPQTENNKDFVITSTSFSTKDNILENLRNNYAVDNHIRSLSTDGNTQSKTTASKSTIVIDTSVVKKITQGNYTSYTMLIESLDDDPDTFYNITIEEFGDSTGMFVTQYKNFGKNKSAKGSLASKNSSSSSIITNRIDDLTKPIGKEDFGNEGGGSSGGGSGGGAGSGSTYPTDCDGIVIVTQVAIPYQCLCNPRHWPWENCDCHTQPGYTFEDSYECGPISNINGTGDSGGSTSGGGTSGTSGSNGEPFNTSLTTPIGDDCKALNLTLNEGYSIKSPFKVDLSDFYPTGCNNIDTSDVSEYEKFMCIYNKLTKTTKFKDLIFDTFGESANLNIKFKISDEITANGQLAPKKITVNTSTGEIVSADMNILIRKSYLTGASAIAVAKTIMHELLHAYLTVKRISCNQGANFDDFENNTLGELLNEYLRDCKPLQGDHEFMFNFMIPTLSAVLAELKDELIPERHQKLAEAELFINEDNPETWPSGDYKLDTPWNWDKFFKYLSMAGLQDSSAFHLEIGTQKPKEKQTPKYKNYYSYAIEYGNNRFDKNCQE